MMTKIADTLTPCSVTKPQLSTIITQLLHPWVPFISSILTIIPLFFFFQIITPQATLHTEKELRSQRVHKETKCVTDRCEYAFYWVEISMTVRRTCGALCRNIFLQWSAVYQWAARWRDEGDMIYFERIFMPFWVFAWYTEIHDA